MTAPTAHSAAATMKAPLKPCVSATGNGEPAPSALVARVAETVLRIARPSEPPTCWVVFSSPEASPESAGATPFVAEIVIGTNDIPSPAPRTIMAGRTWRGEGARAGRGRWTQKAPGAGEEPPP